MAELPTAPSQTAMSGIDRAVFTASSRVGKRSGRNRNRLVVSALVAIVALLATLALIRQMSLALEDLVAEQLEGLAAAAAIGVELWYDHERERVATWAAKDDIEQLTRELIDASSTSRSSGETAAELSRALAPLLTHSDVESFTVVDRAGGVLAASSSQEVGQQLSATGLSRMAEALEKGAEAFAPVSAGSLLAGGSEQGARFVPAIAPIRGTETLGALIVRIDPKQDFQKLFEQTRTGLSGETYAFDSEGWLVSRSRLAVGLEDSPVALLRDETGEIVTFQIRDPGTDLVSGEVPEEGPERWPLTRAVASAVTDGIGSDSRGYRDYRGVMVLGAWRFIDELGIGVVTEIDRAEALRVLRPLKMVIWALFVLVALAAMAFLFSRFRLDRLQQRIDELRQLGQYTLEKKIGEGGVGKVFLARHALLQRPTAVKMLDPEQVSPDSIARFEKEVQLTSQLTHPNTISVYDYGTTPDGVFYYAMEYLAGFSLSRVLELEGRQPEARVLQILRQACGSLREAHSLGLVHRDIKPANIMLVIQGGVPDQVKVLDFGLVREIMENAPSLTQKGMVAGTPAYISPERLRDPNAIDARGDIYALGCVAYDLMVGQPAFRGSSGAEIAAHVLSQETPRISAAGVAVSPELDDLVFRCMAKDPDLRPPSAAALLIALEAIQKSSPWTDEKANAWWQHWGLAAGVTVAAEVPVTASLTDDGDSDDTRQLPSPG